MIFKAKKQTDHKSRLIYGVYRHFQQYLSYIMRWVLLVEETKSTRRKLPTWRKSLTNFVTYCCIE